MIFLSFDIEEFENPFPCSQRLSFEQQMEISKHGTQRILDLLSQKQVHATFFCTANFALHASDLIERMVREGHEVASHGYYHNSFEISHLKESHEILEKITGKAVVGFRMPNMCHVSAQELTNAGYSYNSSLNPTFLPGKYNNFSQPRRIFQEGGLWQIPTSVSPIVRIPLFWLALHNFPLSVYCFLSKLTLRKDGYLNLYFHPWEFVKLAKPQFDLPFYVTHNSGDLMVKRLGSFISHFQQKGITFGCLHQCAEIFSKK
jgi:peptidoglycan/xylan/chitin deacetylase (PgdA/CDA1 family)